MLDGPGGAVGGGGPVGRADGLGQLAAGQRFGAQEPEAAPQCRVHRRDRAVGAVHRAEQVHVVGHLELAARVRQGHREAVPPLPVGEAGPLARLHAEQDVAEHLRHVGPVDLVEQDEEVRVRGVLRLLDDAQQEAVAADEPLLLLVVAHALDEVLVGGTRMERDGVPAGPGAAQFPAGHRGPLRADVADDVGLPGAGRPFDDRVAEPAEHVHEPLRQRRQGTPP